MIAASLLESVQRLRTRSNSRCEVKNLDDMVIDDELVDDHVVEDGNSVVYSTTTGHYYRVVRFYLSISQRPLLFLLD